MGFEICSGAYWKFKTLFIYPKEKCRQPMRTGHEQQDNILVNPTQREGLRLYWTATCEYKLQTAAISLISWAIISRAGKIAKSDY